MKPIALAVLLGLCLFGSSPPISAHHAFQAEYDLTRPVILVGKLTKVALQSPHGWINLDSKSGGKIVNWDLETPNPNDLSQNGFDRSIYQTLVSSGEEVTVTAFAARDGSRRAWAATLIRADGQTIIPIGGVPGQASRGSRGTSGSGASPSTGAWWTNAALVARLGLTSDQKARIENIFEHYRQTIVANKTGLENEEALLARKLEAETLEPSRSVMSQIEKVIQARGEMERTYSKMTLEIRQTLTRGQWVQLQTEVPQPAVLQDPRPGASQRGR
jgi:hypothetical protein